VWDQSFWTKVSCCTNPVDRRDIVKNTMQVVHVASAHTRIPEYEDAELIRREFAASSEVDRDTLYRRATVVELVGMQLVLCFMLCFMLPSGATMQDVLHYAMQQLRECHSYITAQFYGSMTVPQMYDLGATAGIFQEERDVFDVEKSLLHSDGLDDTVSVDGGMGATSVVEMSFELGLENELGDLLGVSQNSSSVSPELEFLVGGAPPSLLALPAASAVSQLATTEALASAVARAVASATPALAAAIIAAHHTKHSKRKHKIAPPPKVPRTRSAAAAALTEASLIAEVASAVAAALCASSRKRGLVEQFASKMAKYLRKRE
jgi:hypothetical protein